MLHCFAENIHSFFRCVVEVVNYMDINAAVLLQFVLMTQTCPFALQVEPKILLETSPVQHQFRLVFPHLARLLILRLK
jgi:hypothetical protein